ncbi:MAG: ATP-dependent DNA ligase [Solirubrobacteraceae bacterium]|jgi:bifunctional non-homologous end joining protein LigD
MQHCVQEELPRFIEPMLASAGPAPTTADWAMEVKWDGARAQLRFDGRTVCVRSRPGRDCTGEFPELLAIAGALGTRTAVLDGELVCFGADGKPDFGALRSRLGAGQQRRCAVQRGPAVKVMLFDLLHVDGFAVRRLGYECRRETLAELELEGPAWSTPRHFVGEGERLLCVTAEHGLEGVVAKRLDSRYAEGRRSGAWRKHKHRRRERLVVTGWRERDGMLPEFLLARRRPERRLIPAGSASLGLDGEHRAQLLEALAQHAISSRGRRGSVRWVSPVIDVLVDVHGPADGAVRDAIIREICPPQALGR